MINSDIKISYIDHNGANEKSFEISSKSLIGVRFRERRIQAIMRC